MKKVILVDTGSESNHMMMSDVGKMENGIQISDLYHLKSPVLKFLFKAHLGFRLNQYFDMPLKGIWNSFCVLDDYLTDAGTEYYVILVNDVIRKISDSYLKKLYAMPNVHVYILLLDSYNKLQPYFRRCIDRFDRDKIYSFQKSDCLRYGYHYTNTIYSKIDIENRSNEYDVYFVGAEKDRMEDIYNIYQYLENNQVKCRFVVIIDRKKLKKYKLQYPGIVFETKRIPYHIILEDISKTKCILELCQKGQDGLTMRFYEAVFYNKILLTNNHSSMEHTLYNNQYMSVFDSADDIDISMIKSDSHIDYQYQDEMSPIHFAEDIISKE